MKNVIIAFCLFFVGVSIFAQNPNPPFASKIILRSPDGKRTITIEARNDIAGFWTSNKENRRSIAIYDANDQTGIGIYPDTRAALLNCLTVDGEGNGRLQFYKDGKLIN